MDTDEISQSQSATKDLSLSGQEQVHIHKLTVEAAKVVHTWMCVHVCQRLHSVVEKWYTHWYRCNGTILVV